MPHHRGHSLPHVWLPPGTNIPGVSDLIDWPTTARRAIDAKAAALGAHFTGPPEGDVSQYPDTAGGDKTFGRRYANCSIYYSRPTGANETHGAIRAKYDQIDGMNLLGIPVTDEWACPDGIGRYNHFEKAGSIYWHPDTGPFTVRGRIRDVWAQRGWEQGALGYPVADQRFRTPSLEATLFQNGALSDDGTEVTDAAVARLEPAELLTVVWQMFDRLVHQSPDNVGLHPHRSIDRVAGYSGDFWRAHNRVISLTINGFRDNGLAPDTDWSAHLGLRLQDTAESGGHNIYVWQVHGSVDADGPGSEAVSRGVAEAIGQAFRQPMRVAAPPDPNRPSVPGDVGFIGLLGYADGAVGLTFCNTAVGRVAALVARRSFEALLG